jgi:polyisoprenoid-binding protein YceI
MAEPISAEGLRRKQTASPPPILVDVRLAEDFAVEHLPGALNNCVFEMAFLDRMKNLAQTGQPVVVYGADDTSLESRVAAEKLTRAGYQAVFDFQGGVAAWHSDQGPLESGAPLPTEAQPPDGTWRIDPDASSIRWTGRNFLKLHTGTIAVREGQVELVGGRLAGGQVTIEMARIRCTDLEGSELHGVLIAHLHSDDFFDLARFPDASIRFQSVTPIQNAAPGGRNVRINAALTLLGQTHPVCFPAMTGWDDAGRWGCQANLTIERTRWGMIYGSGRFFRRLGQHVVNDEIDLDVALIASN